MRSGIYRSTPAPPRIIPPPSLGSVCIYQASGEEAVRRHAEKAGLPCDEVVPVADTVIVSSDPG
jgi:hypothetical protein